VHYNTNSSKYEVDDIDEEQKERHMLSRRRVVALPLMRANPETDSDALFHKGTLVMALYPQTTCFIKLLYTNLRTVLKTNIKYCLKTRLMRKATPRLLVSPKDMLFNAKKAAKNKND